MPPVPDSEKNLERCICGGCPSYPGTGRFYCARGESGTEVARRGCVCGECEVYKEYGLSGEYYCAQVSAGQAEA